MTQLVECVPNFSEGRKPEIYNAIADQIRAVAGTRLLSVSADADHNRTVITFVGTPDAVEEAAFRAIAKAAQLINLDQHRGEHPRIGATDVCPLVPVRNVTLADCVAMAQRLGKRVGEELGIAVYLYEAAATRPDREKLSEIRKGEYELWKAEVATNPNRKPDFGPAQPQSWGATVIGARPFLIAYNLYLNSDKVEIANEIAKAVRFTTGGLRYVQALGFLVEGQAQVSMNLTNFEKTPIYRVQEMVRREAERYGLTITKAELVGLTPQKALLDAAKWYLQIDNLQDEQILEYQLAQPENRAEERLLVGFVNEVASSTPTPGGGSVAALAGSLAAALTQMIAGLTAGRKKYAAVSEEAQEVLREGGKLKGQLLDAIVEDSAAFDQLLKVIQNKLLDSQSRMEALEKATIETGEVPLRVAYLSLQIAKLGQRMVKVGNANAVTDGASAGIMARAAVQIAALNVKINAKGLQNQELARSWIEQINAIEAETLAVVENIVATAAQRGGFA